MVCLPVSLELSSNDGVLVSGLAHLPEDGLVVHTNYAGDQAQGHQAFLSQLCQTVQKTLKEICDQCNVVMVIKVVIIMLCVKYLKEW